MDIFVPFQFIANTITYTLLRFLPHTYVSEALIFFIYDTLKIGALLIGINYMMAIIRYYFPIEKVRNILTKKRWFGLDYLMAAVLGIITPFCSCSSIPLFIGFLSAGIPLGVTFTFLITSPLVNEASLALFPALFGLNVTILYNVVGVGVGVLGGMVIQRLHMEKYIESSLLRFKSRKDAEAENEGKQLSMKELLFFWWNDGWEISQKIFPYMLIGVSVGALIHGFVPARFFEQYLSANQLWTVPLATVLGAPLYANSVSVLPIMEALVNKGVPLGTALAFMTATVTLSIPEALMLKKAMKWQLLGSFFLITILGIIFLGYFFNSIPL